MKIFRNRTVIGVLCILLALVICFGVTPLFSRSASEKAEIVRVTADIKEGDEITAEMVQTVEVGAYNLPSGIMTEKDEVVGKYATADLKVGDYILASKLSNEPAAENAYLYNLDGTKQAISVTIKSFATGLSGKLESGDIVSVLVADYQGMGETVIPPELQYVEVISVTASSGYTISNVYYPDGDSQLVWVKWHTPDEPCVCTIQVRVLGGGTAQSTITANIVDLDGNDPPNPVADDRNDTFTLVDIPEKEEVSSASWGIWSPWWQENWVWVENWEKCWHTDRWTDSEGKSHTDRWYHWVDNGWWEDQGWWEFDYNAYTASLTATMVITPDSLSPTASSSTLKSGYGIQQSVTASVSTTQSAAVTAAQNAVTYFPEFNYEGFWRLLNRSISGKRSTFTFKDNPYSTYNRPTHFTPIWYPDGSYTPYTWLLDCWTPAGMLSLNLTDSVRISGDLWEDWHIAPTN